MELAATATWADEKRRGKRDPVAPSATSFSVTGREKNRCRWLEHEDKVVAIRGHVRKRPLCAVSPPPPCVLLEHPTWAITRSLPPCA